MWRPGSAIAGAAATPLSVPVGGATDLIRRVEPPIARRLLGLISGELMRCASRAPPVETRDERFARVRRLRPGASRRGFGIGRRSGRPGSASGAAAFRPARAPVVAPAAARSARRRRAAAARSSTRWRAGLERRRSVAGPQAGRPRLSGGGSVPWAPRPARPDELSCAAAGGALGGCAAGRSVGMSAGAVCGCVT
jgi:hypothetical protein